MRDALRVKHYALSTENSYVDWAERFIRFHHMRHPSTMGEPDIAAFLTHLAVEENIAASTQSQALSAILFLYRHVLHRELDGRIDLVRAKKSRHLPVVLTKAEVQAVLRHVPSEYQMMAKLLYGSGLRLMECVRLRVKHVLSLPKETWTSSNARSWCAMARA
jgi:site-specific recombinase XerD